VTAGEVALLTLLDRLHHRGVTRAWLPVREYQADALTAARLAEFEEQALRFLGRELYENFFYGYTKKQWGVEPSQLDKSVTARVPTRTNTDDRYFSDKYQFMPAAGYTPMFERILDHPNIEVMLDTDYRDIKRTIRYRRVIFTGPIDEFFDYRYGKLPYRSLEFKHETLDQEQALPVAVVNYPNEHAYTRVTEFKHLTGQVHPKTSIVYEFPQSEGDPYYPVPRPENAVLYKQYQALADATPNVHFVGRLATYRYYNMDQIVAQALAVFAKISQGPRHPAEVRKEVEVIPLPLLTPTYGTRLLDAAAGHKRTEGEELAPNPARRLPLSVAKGSRVNSVKGRRTKA